MFEFHIISPCRGTRPSACAHAGKSAPRMPCEGRYRSVVRQGFLLPSSGSGSILPAANCDRRSIVRHTRRVISKCTLFESFLFHRHAIRRDWNRTCETFHMMKADVRLVRKTIQAFDGWTEAAYGPDASFFRHDYRKPAHCSARARQLIKKEQA